MYIMPVFRVYNSFIIMNIIETNIKNLLLIEPEVFGDRRGYFFESFRADALEPYAAGINFVQDNESMSSYGVIRGLHFQKPPYAQSKLVRVVSGEVLDVVVDLRKGSSTYGKHFAVRLSDENKRQLFIPKGFAHGFAVLSSVAVFAYKCDEYYHPESEGGLAYDDAELGIDWIIPEKDRVLSEKDRKNPSLNELTGLKI